jgi:divalent metal cation (Fe/Co/Zn/Cd) transporter
MVKRIVLFSDGTGNIAANVYGRVEDFAGFAIVLIILSSALVAGLQAIDRLISPPLVLHLGWLVTAGLSSLIGAEL